MKNLTLLTLLICMLACHKKDDPTPVTPIIYNHDVPGEYYGLEKSERDGSRDSLRVKITQDSVGWYTVYINSDGGYGTPAHKDTIVTATSDGGILWGAYPTPTYNAAHPNFVINIRAEKQNNTLSFSYDYKYTNPTTSGITIVFDSRLKKR